jgi:hypothetical protein
MFDFMSGVNRFWNFLRLNFFPLLLGLVTRSKMVKKRIFPLISQTGIAYPNSYLTEESSIGKVKAGDRMHYFVFSNGKNIFTYLTEPAFKLLYFGDENKNKSQQLSNSKIKMTCIAFDEIPKAIFGKATNFYILLRPDNHISYIGNDIDACIKLVAKWST